MNQKKSFYRAKSNPNSNTGDTKSQEMQSWPQGASNPSLDFDGQKTTVWPFLFPQKRVTNRESPSRTRPLLDVQDIQKPSREGPGWRPSVRPPALSDESSATAWQMQSPRIRGWVSVGVRTDDSDASVFTEVNQQVTAKEAPHQEKQFQRRPSSKT